MANVTITVRLPPEVHAAAVALATREDRTLNNLILRLVRQATERDHDRRLLEDSIAEAQRGHTVVVTDEMRRRLRAEIEQGAPAGEALARAGL
jgi:hypothetical protein